MAKERHENYEFLGNVVVSLMDTDKLFTYDFLGKELRISRGIISALRKGEDKSVYEYIRVIGFMTELIHLKIMMDVLLKQLRLVLFANRDLVIGTVPHHSYGNGKPEEWVVVMRWERTC